eukprot:Selendium_serpulae@DN1309_c0_g1_i1.p1
MENTEPSNSVNVHRAASQVARKGTFHTRSDSKYFSRTDSRGLTRNAGPQCATTAVHSNSRQFDRAQTLHPSEHNHLNKHLSAQSGELQGLRNNETRVEAEAYPGAERQRIRKRKKKEGAGLADELAATLIEGTGEPLITEEEKRHIRETAWVPKGENVPTLANIELGYHEAWDIGKQGCVGVKVSGDWTANFGANKLRFFIMDGTDESKSTER